MVNYCVRMVRPSQLPGTRPRSRPAAGLPAVTPDQIVEAAVALTMKHGLERWTIRQLAGVVQAYPAVVYHHVGGRDAVLAAVLERVVGMLRSPPAELPWRDWFRVLLGELRAVLRRYPGVARRFSLHGPGISAAGPIIDRGVALLRAAGFGEESAPTCNLLLGTACQLLAVEDDREARAATPVGLSAAHRADLPGLVALGAFVDELSASAERRAGFYDYAVERCLDGAAARLAVLLG